METCAEGEAALCFEVGDGTSFAFAGLWDRWRAPDNQTIETCTI